MKKILSLLLLLLSCVVFAQNGTVSGVISDAKTGDPLEFVNVTVSLDGLQTGTQGDLDGNYSLPLPAGTHELTFVYLGYPDKKETVTLGAGENITLNVSMEEEATLLDMVVVSATRNARPLGESTVSMEVIQPSLIENTNAPTVEGSIQKVPGVTIIDGQANIRGGAGYSYGAGTRVLLLVDDMPILTGDSGYPDWDAIPVENISQVEVIKGAASALYGSSAMNGIINIRTAYATAEPETKISVFGGYYEKPNFTNDTLSKNDVWYGQGDRKMRLFSLKDSLNDRTPGQFGFSLLHKRKIGKKFDLVIGGNLYSRDSWRETAFSRRARLNVNTRYRITDNLSVGINTNLSARKSVTFFLWGGDTGILDPLIASLDPEKTHAIDETKYFQTWDPVGGPSNRIYTFTIDPFLTYINDKGIKHKLLSRYYYRGLLTNTNQDLLSNFLYGEYQFQKNWDDKGMTVTAGLTGTRSWTGKGTQLYAGGDISLTSTNMAFYGQVDKKFFDKLNISLGFRVERNTISDTQEAVAENGTIIQVPDDENYISQTRPVGRLGINYQLADYTFLRASFGQGYRFPTIAEKFVTTNLGGVINILPNPDIEPETGISAELGLKQGFKLGGWKGFFDIAGFYTEYDDMMEFSGVQLPLSYNGIDYVNNVTGQPTLIVDFLSLNIGDTRIYGGEVSVAGTGMLFNRLPTNLMMGYTYTKPEFQNFDSLNQVLSSRDENILKYRFQHSVKFDLETTYDFITVGTTVLYNSRMEAVDQPFINVLAGMDYWYQNELNRNGHARWDARVTFNLGDHHKIGIIGENLMNHFYAIRPGLMEAPRNWQVKYSVNF